VAAVGDAVSGHVRGLGRQGSLSPTGGDLQSPGRRRPGAAPRLWYGWQCLQSVSTAAGDTERAGRRTGGESPLQHLVDIHDCRRVCAGVKEGYRRRTGKGAVGARRVGGGGKKGEIKKLRWARGVGREFEAK
jgi:hypothetical protein